MVAIGCVFFFVPLNDLHSPTGYESYNIMDSGVLLCRLLRDSDLSKLRPGDASVFSFCLSFLRPPRRNTSKIRAASASGAAPRRTDVLPLFLRCPSHAVGTDCSEYTTGPPPRKSTPQFGGSLTKVRFTRIPVACACCTSTKRMGLRTNIYRLLKENN